MTHFERVVLAFLALMLLQVALQTLSLFGK
jgi:hypothetical protein